MDMVDQQKVEEYKYEMPLQVSGISLVVAASSGVTSVGNLREYCHAGRERATRHHRTEDQL